MKKLFLLVFALLMFSRLGYGSEETDLKKKMAEEKMNSKECRELILVNTICIMDYDFIYDHISDRHLSIYEFIRAIDYNKKTFEVLFNKKFDHNCSKYIQDKPSDFTPWSHSNIFIKKYKKACLIEDNNN